MTEEKEEENKERKWRSGIWEAGVLPSASYFCFLLSILFVLGLMLGTEDRGIR